jgi:hypothetical protein
VRLEELCKLRNPATLPVMQVSAFGLQYTASVTTEKMS